ncbi:MAG: hypothetical protein ACLTIG_00095 [Roseburia hominis]
MRGIREFIREEDGVGVVELILILVVLNINHLLWGEYKVYNVRICV